MCVSEIVRCNAPNTRSLLSIRSHNMMSEKRIVYHAPFVRSSASVFLLLPESFCRTEAAAKPATNDATNGTKISLLLMFVIVDGWMDGWMCLLSFLRLAL